MWFYKANILVILTHFQVCHGFDFWPKIISEFDGKSLCLLRDQNGSDKIGPAISALYESAIYVSMVHNVQDLFNTCDFSTRAVIFILDMPELSLRDLFATASQAELRNNLWIIGNTDNDTIVREAFSRLNRRFGLRVKIFSVNSNSLDMYQILGTATENHPFKVSILLIAFI